MKCLLKVSVFAILAFMFGLLHAQATGSPPNAPSLVFIDGVPASGDWRLPEGHFVSAKMPMRLIHPRPDSETSSYARHRKAYPGIEYRIPVAVQGGAYPFHYEIVRGPEGMTIGEQYGQTDYGIVLWTPRAEGGPYTVEIRITDQELTTQSALFEIRVTSSTDDFIFVDGSVARSGDGSIGAPLKTLTEIMDGDQRRTAYPGRAVYFREGKYHVTTGDGHYWNGTGNRGIVDLRSEYRPKVFLGYPGENATIDFVNGLIRARGGADLFVGGLKLINAPQRAIDTNDTWMYGGRMFIMWAGVRPTWFENDWDNIRNQWLDRGFNLEYVSANSFKVLGYDATQSGIYNQTISGSAARGGNFLRFYDQVSDLANPDTHVAEATVSASSFDGRDTTVVMNQDVVTRANLVQVRQKYQGGNEGGIHSNASGSHKPNWTVWGNRFTNYQERAVGSLYSVGPAVVEGNTLGSSIGNPSSGIDFKASSTFVSFRRNISTESRFFNGALQNEGFVTGQVGTTGGNQQFEFCYNLVADLTDLGVSISPKRVGSPTSGTDHTQANSWVYRNTVIGRMSGNASAGSFWFEGNLYFTDQDKYPSGNVTVEGDLAESFDAKTRYLDSEFRLKGEFREKYLGVLGHEIAN